jgi:hypothetical protein
VNNHAPVWHNVAHPDTGKEANTMDNNIEQPEEEHGF